MHSARTKVSHKTKTFLTFCFCLLLCALPLCCGISTASALLYGRLCALLNFQNALSMDVVLSWCCCRLLCSRLGTGEKSSKGLGNVDVFCPIAPAIKALSVMTKARLSHRNHCCKTCRRSCQNSCHVHYSLNGAINKSCTESERQASAFSPLFGHLPTTLSIACNSELSRTLTRTQSQRTRIHSHTSLKGTLQRMRPPSARNYQMHTLTNGCCWH